MLLIVHLKLHGREVSIGRGVIKKQHILVNCGCKPDLS